MDRIRSMESLQFDFGTIRVATDNFSEANKLGEGGFGAVYKVNRHILLEKGTNDHLKDANIQGLTLVC